MKLADKIVATLVLPDGKDDVIYWDDDPKRLGYRLRRSSDKVLRSWVVRYRIGTRQRRMTLDAVLNAEQARAAAKKLLARVELGEDPQGDKAKQRAGDKLTVRALVEEYLADKRAELRPKTLRDTTTYLTGSYFKPLHSLAIEKVTRRDVAACLTKIKREHSIVVAGGARAKLSAFFVWAMRQGFVEHNPVIGTEMGKRVAPRERVLSDDELRRVWNAAVEIGGHYGAIVRLLILLGARRQEVGGMAWSELDLDGRQPTWTLPAARSKNGRAHTLPLLPMARDIVRAVPQLVSRDQLFGSRARIGFANWGEGKAALDERSGVTSWTVHDVRRTFSTKLHDDPLGADPHIVEALLNHHSGHRSGPPGTYNKASYRARMVSTLAKWEDYIRTLVEGGERKVLQFAPAAP